MNEKRHEELLGGPCDGLVLDLYPTDTTAFPGPHHLRECGVIQDGVAHFLNKAKPMYVRGADGRLRYHGSERVQSKV